MSSQRWFWIFAFVIIFGTMGFSPPRQNNAVTIDLYPAGFDGYYRPGYWVPLRVNLKNEGNAINDGILQLSTQSLNSNTEVLYKAPVSLARGAEKSIFLYVSLNRNSRDVEVELLDDNGRVVQRQKAPLEILAPEDLLFAVVTDSPRGAIPLQESRIGTGEVQQVHWAIDEIPPNADVLRAVDMMIIYNVDTDALGENITVLEQWVNGGGHLVIHGGFYYFNIIKGLETLLPTTISEAISVPSLEALGAYIGYPDEKLAQSTQVNQNTPHDDAQVLFELSLADGSTVPMIVRRHIGAGTVDFVAVDPQEGALRDYDAIPILWRELFADTAPRPSWSYSFQDWNSADLAVKEMVGIELPSAVQMFVFLALYIFIIGPVNYLILRAIRRSELAWLTIPSVIVVFTLIAYFTGFSLRGDEPTVSYLNVVQTWNGSDTARVDGLVGLFSPRRTTYDFSIPEDLTLRTLPLVTTVDNSKIAEVNIRESTTYQIESLPVDAGIITGFATGGYIPAPKLNGEATWYLSNDNQIELEGSFTNNETFTLEDAVLLTKDSFKVLGDIPGIDSEGNNTIEFDLNVMLSNPSLFPQGSLTDIGQTTPFLPFNNNNNYYSSSYSQTYATDCSNGSVNSLLDQVMDNQVYDCNDRTGERENQILRRRALMLVAINHEIDYSGGRGGDIYIVGWAKETPYRIDIDGTDHLVEAETLHIVRLNTRYESLLQGGLVRLHQGLLTWTSVHPQNSLSVVAPYNFDGLRYDDEAILRFSPLATIPIESISMVEVEFRGRTNQRDALVDFWNWETGEWDRQVLNFALRANNPNNFEYAPFYLPTPTPYLSQNGVLQLRVQIGTEDARLYEFSVDVAIQARLVEQ